MSFKQIITCLCLSLIPPLQVYSQTTGEQHISGFGGVNNFLDPMMIADGDFQDAKNIITDEGDVRTIPGNILYAVSGSSAISFLGEYVSPSGTHLLISKQGASIYASTSVIKVLSADRDIDMVSAFNNAYFTDGTTGAFNYNGTSVSASVGFEDCKYVEYYQGRMVCVNMSTDTAKIYLSWYNNPNLWTVTTDPNSGEIKYFDKDDGYPINCVKNTPFGLFLGKQHSTQFLKGESNPTFYQISLSGDVGCVDDRTVQLVDGELVWLSQDGWYAYDGSSAPRPISIEIRNTTKNIRQSASSDSNWLMNTQGNWESGSNTTLWQTLNGNLSAPAYYTSIGATMGFLGEGGEDGSPFGTGWFTYPGGVSLGTYTGAGHAKYGNNSFTLFNGAVALDSMMLVNSSGVLISSMNVSIPPVTNTWYDYSLNTSSDTNIRLVLCPTDVSQCAESALFNGKYGGYISEWRDASLGWYLLDHAEAVTNKTDTTTIDSGMIAPPYTGISYSTVTTSVKFYTSADNNSWTGPITVFSTSTYKRYYRFTATYVSSSSKVNYMTPLIQSATVYYSPVHFTASDIMAWKQFTVNDLGVGVSPTYSVRTATYSFTVNASSPIWVSQPKNGTVVDSVKPYIQFKIETNITNSTQSVMVNSINTVYTVGSVAPPAASVVSDHRYICAVSTGSSTQNDITFIWQKNKKWTFSWGVSYGALSLYNNQPLAGDGTTTGKIWTIMQPTAYSFDHTAIDSYLITKSFAFSAVNNQKVLNRIWVTADNSGLQNLGVGYQSERDGIWHSTYTALSGANFVIREVEGLGLPSLAKRQFAFKVSANELDKYFRLKLFSVYFTVNPLIK